MEFERLVSKEQNTCDKFVATSCFFIVIFMLLVWTLNILRIFVVASYAMTICAVFTCILMLVPVVLYELQKRGYCKKINYRYTALAFILTVVCILYSFLTFHVIILFTFPAIIFNIYGDKKLMKYAMSGTIIIMIISHIFSQFIGVNPEEPFRDMKTIIVYGLLPKIIIYSACFYAFIYETNHNNKMIKKVYNYAYDMQQTQEELVKAFAEMCESKSGQTGRHVKRVSEYVRIMAKYFNIKGQENQCLVTAAMMHDVGKLNIPSEILDKQGKLTDDEYSIIKKHTDFGYELLKNSPGRTMEIARDIALNHHERWDGKGYNGLKGTQISLYSRITALADVFDALVSSRSYKKAWNYDDACREIISQSGKQFDPDVVNGFIRYRSEFITIAVKLSD